MADPPFFGGPGQGSRQIIELFVAFGLTALIGLEREIQGKSAGLRTQTIVGTAAALILLISKYGFSDVLSPGTVILDPSRVAAQIVTGIGFLGAGIIITRRGAVHGLTTAAAVWESAAIGMAAGSGLLLLACTVTAMHFLIILGFMPLVRRLAARLSGSIRMHVTYEEGRGVMRPAGLRPAPVATHRVGRRCAGRTARCAGPVGRDADVVGQRHFQRTDSAGRYRRRHRDPPARGRPRLGSMPGS